MIISLGYVVINDDSNDVKVSLDHETDLVQLKQDSDVVVVSRVQARELGEAILTLLDETE